MKRIIIATLSLASVLIGCDVESPMDKDLYPQRVSIVGAKDKIVYRDLDLGNTPDTISISIAVGGSRPTNQDVTVELIEVPEAITDYNERNISVEAVQFQKLNDAIYQYPLSKLTIPKGEVYSTYPVVINPTTLHCDSLYMLPLKLASTSAYELNDEDTIALVRINLVNKYSGLYYVDAVLKNTDNPNDSLVYKMSRNLLATDNGHTVRKYHVNNEFRDGDTNDYRITHAFKISVNEPDSTLSFATWDQFMIYGGGGNYYPTLKLYKFWYEYDNNGTKWRAEGFLYKERKTEEEKRIVEDWIEDQHR